MFGTLIFYICLSIGVSFFCSVAEAVLLSISPSYIEDMKQKGHRSAKLLESLKEKVDRPLAAILTLNTIAHTAGAAGVGATAANIWGSNAVGIASAIMTVGILVFSEIIPKTLGAVYWRSIAPMIGRSIRLLILILYPFVIFSEFVTRVIGGHKQNVITRDEVAAMASLSVDSGELHEFESTILQNLLKLRTVEVRDIMTPRTVIISFPESISSREALGLNKDLPVSRIPIYQESIDHVTGFVLKNDILTRQSSPDLCDNPIKELKRDIIRISESSTLPALLDGLINQRQHIALVVDEHGGTSGLVTMEDLFETLLGSEIVDEADKVVDMRKLARARWEERARNMGLNIEESNPKA